MEKIFDTKTPFDRFGLMLDCSRSGVMSVNATKRMIDFMEGMDYNMLMLYTEDTYEVEGQPYFGHLRGRYKKEELKVIFKALFSTLRFFFFSFLFLMRGGVVPTQ